MLPDDGEIHESFFTFASALVAAESVLIEWSALPVPAVRHSKGLFYSPATLRAHRRSSLPPSGPSDVAQAQASQQPSMGPLPPSPELAPVPYPPVLASASETPGPLASSPSAAIWLRNQEGQVEQRVLLCTFPARHSWYEQHYGWAPLSQFTPHKVSLVPVRLDSGQDIHVNSQYLYLCNAQDHARATPEQQLLIVPLHLRFDNKHKIPIRALIDTGCQLDCAVN